MRLQGRGIENLWCSPLMRAKETAEIVGKTLGLTPVVRQDLIEFDVGALEGRDDEEAWELYCEHADHWLQGKFLGVGVEGGESVTQMSSRMARFLSEIAATDGTHLAITHGGFIRCSLPWVIEGMPPNKMANQHLEPTGYVVMEKSPQSWTVSAWNVNSDR